MSIFQKIKWIFAIIFVLIIVIATNLIDKRNFNNITNSIEAIYNDRLIAKGLIFDFTGLIHEKEIAYLTSDSLFVREKNHFVNAELKKLIELYKKTELTEDEQRVFNRFLTDVDMLITLDANTDTFPFQNRNYFEIIQKIKADLVRLSKVQIKEGKRLLAISQKNMETVELFTQIEIILLVIMAIIIQIIILYNPPKKPKDLN